MQDEDPSTAPKMDGLLFAPSEPPKRVEVVRTAESISALLGGEYEMHRVVDDIVMLCRSDDADDLLPNDRPGSHWAARVGYLLHIKGSFLLLNCGRKGLRSLTDAEMDHLTTAVG